MQGVTIGATEGIFYEEDFRNAEEKRNVKVEWIPQDEMIIRMLLAGRIDVFVQDIMWVIAYLRNTSRQRKDGW